jgi:hypothetical protein
MNSDYETITDQQLIEQTKSEARDWMMYQAADGHSSAAERKERNACTGRLKALRRELSKRGLPIV